MGTVKKASDQLDEYKKEHPTPEQATTSFGAPQHTCTATMTVGDNGPVLIQDTFFLDTMTHFDRERIPERVVHAKGGGAFGYFEVTHDITKYCKAKIFSKVGKKTDCLVRFSTVGGESGSADTARDPRGFAMKFYTEDGIWDIVGNNTPIFFIRDPILFPSFIHTQKRNPATHLKDPNMFWDFITLRPETTHQVCFLFGDRGVPDGHRHMNGYGSHSFKMVNAKGHAVYVKFHFKTDQKIKNIMSDRAEKLCGSDPDYSNRDLYEAIDNGNFPSWTLYIQVMTFEEAEKYKWNPFDLTKIWSHKHHPLIPVGKMVLNRNPANYFSDIEQSAFSPANMVQGIEPSPDKMLQGRLFSYHDTHIHRLGLNYHQLPVNCPYACKPRHYQRDGPQAFVNHGGAPNYYPNSFNGPQPDEKSEHHVEKFSGECKRVETGTKDNYSQVTTFWEEVLNEEERERLVANIAGHVKDAKDFIQQRAVKNFTEVHADFGSKLEKALKAHAKNAHL